MTKPFDPCLVLRAPLPAAASTISPKGFLYTADVKNRQRSRTASEGQPPVVPSSSRLTLATVIATLALVAFTPNAALAEEGDEMEEDVAVENVTAAPSPPAAPDPSLTKLKKLQEEITKAQEAYKKAQEKAAAEKTSKSGKDKAGKDKVDKSAKKEPTPEEKAIRGVVTVERGGQVLGLGAVLAGDGRVLTALSSLGPGNDLETRFADGTAVRVKLGHHDRMWDLALLVPQTGKWPDGLTASSRDPVRQDATLRGYSLARGKPGAVSMALRGYRGLLGGDDKLLDRAIELGSRVSPTDLGSPVIDEEGRVVAVVGRACAPNEGRPCTPVAFGIPMTAIKSFLRSVPPTAVAPPAWLGIQGVSETGSVAKGVRITVVHPESPADGAKLKGGDRATSDMILAVDGVPVTSPEALADVMKTHSVGEKVPLTLFSEGKYKQVTVLLRAAPSSRQASNTLPNDPTDLPALQEATPAAPHRVKLVPHRP